MKSAPKAFYHNQFPVIAYSKKKTPIKIKNKTLVTSQTLKYYIKNNKMHDKIGLHVYLTYRKI